MPPPFLIDLSRIDLSRAVAGADDIEAVNPQRGHMRHLDGIVWMNDDKTEVVGYKDVRDDEFWVAGHIPGRPLLPGVLMIEAGAQLAAFVMRMRMPNLGFVGFVGCDDVKFRGQVAPGQRLYVLGRQMQLKPRRVIFAVQGVAAGTLVFEGAITGMPI